MEKIVNGDGCLSPFMRNLWALTYSCLIEFQCPVIFTVQGPNVPQKYDQFITFFVPSTNENCYEVIQYLKKELKNEERAANDGEYGYFYGVHVYVFEYTETDPYMKRADSKKMAQSLMKSFFNKINKLKGSN